ncbi:hypothetical protein ACTA71_002337 [Dictyostelium dimigraforme]
MKYIFILIVLFFNLNLILTQSIDGLTPNYFYTGIATWVTLYNKENKFVPEINIRLIDRTNGVDNITYLPITYINGSYIDFYLPSKYVKAKNLITTYFGQTIYGFVAVKIINPMIDSSLIISSSSTNDLLISGDGFGPTAIFTLQEPLSNINHSLSCINTYPFKLMTCTIPQNNLINNCYTINVKDDYTNTTSLTTFTKPSLNSIELIGNTLKFGLNYNCPGSNPTINLNINSQNVGSIPSNYIYSPTVNLCLYYGNSFNVSITTSFNSYSNLTSDSILFDCSKGVVINNSSNTDENSTDSNCINTSIIISKNYIQFRVITVGLFQIINTFTFNDREIQGCANQSFFFSNFQLLLVNHFKKFNNGFYWLIQQQRHINKPTAATTAHYPINVGL